MPNTITPFKKYINKLDTVYVQAAATSVLDADPETVIMGQNAGEFLIPMMTMDGLADYDRGTGYASGNVSIAYQTKKCGYDRGRKFDVDAMDDEETAGIAFGKLAGEFVRTRATPEMDAYRLATYAGMDGILTEQAKLTTGEEVLAALIAAVNAQDEAEVNHEGKVLFITPTLLTLAKNVKTTVSKAILERFSEIKEVPQPRFYTAIELLDGKSGDELAGGYKPADGANPINFFIINKDAVIQFGKHTVNKIISPDANQTSDGYMFFYRAYSIAEIYDNKRKGLYCHISPSAQVPTELKNGYGKSVSDLIADNVKISADGSVTGNIKKVTDYTGFSGVKAEQSGHYLPVVLDSRYSGKTISCQRDSDDPKTSTDLEWVLRIPSSSTKFTFKADDEIILTLNFERATLE